MTPEEALCEMRDTANLLERQLFTARARDLREAAEALEQEIRDLRERFSKVPEALGEVVDERDQT